MLREISIEELRTRSDWDLIALQRAIGACLAELEPGTAEHTAMLRTWRNIVIVRTERRPTARPDGASTLHHGRLECYKIV